VLDNKPHVFLFARRSSEDSKAPTGSKKNENSILQTEQEERMLKKQLKKVNDDYRAVKRQLGGTQFTCFTSTNVQILTLRGAA